VNTDGKSLRLTVLVSAIALLLLAGFIIARGAPRFNSTKIPTLFIGKNWPGNQIDRLTLPSDEFTCHTQDDMHWSCTMMLDGKRLEMGGSYGVEAYKRLASCTVFYGGTPYACQVTMGYQWQSRVMVNTDMGISAERMAELRAQRPLPYMSESTWMQLGAAWASALAFLTTLLLLTLYNRVASVALPVVNVRIPLWILCLVVIGLALLFNQATGVIFILPLAIPGTCLLLMLIIQLNKRDRKRGPSLAHALMWTSVSLVMFWVMDFAAIFGMMWIGYVD
jgi:hypothetical protein